MNAQQHIEKAHTLAGEWFVNHKAELTLKQGDALTIIEWRRPETFSYAIRFVIMDGYVIVTGDLGEAIYAFHAGLNLEKLATFDWHYFINKCVASETGRSYTMKVPGVKSPVPNVRAIAHFIGLQMAIKQLRS